MTRIAIVDDESLAIKRLQIKLAKFPDLDVVAVARDGDGAISLMTKFEPELMFLDIGMPGKNGLEVARVAANRNTHVIFTTAFQQYAVQAFEENAIDYLLKPIETDRLASAIDRFRQFKKQDDAIEKIEELQSIVSQLRRASLTEARVEKPPYFWNQDNGNMQKIRTSDIEWVQASRDYILLYMKEGRTHLIRHTLSGFEEFLDKNQFQRVHRSSIVNLPSINKVIKRNGKTTLITRSGHEVTVGRSYRQATLLKIKQLPLSFFPI